ncbi:nucleotide modification associated domain-containing protein [Priestia megaterium]|uniref:nucleotide modification associated domain-containing protein n=1 Tax=Priestia megaterium TaxID=1404 RepID=UPI003CC644A0
MVEYKIGDRIEVLSTGAVGHIASKANKYGEYEIAMSDHIIPLTLKHYEIKHYNNPTDDERKFKLKQKVYITYGEFSGLIGIIESYDKHGHAVYIPEVDLTRLFGQGQIEAYEKGDTNMNTDHQLHKNIINEIHDTYLRKNADYGNSFGDQYSEYGLLSALIRLDDKMRRLKQLTKQEAQVKDESIRDTVLDLANYAIMTVMELDKENAEPSS